MAERDDQQQPQQPATEEKSINLNEDRPPGTNILGHIKRSQDSIDQRPNPANPRDRDRNKP